MTLQRYVLKQFLLALAFSLAGISFVLLPAILVNAVNKVGSAGLVALLGYLPLVVADLVPYIAPLAFLLAVVSTYGRMAAEREWTAVRAAGIHPANLLLPCALVALVLGAGTDWLASTLAPAWKLEQRNYKSAAVKEAVKRLAPGRTEFRVPGFFLKAARRDPVHPIFYQAYVSILQKAGSEGGRKDLWAYADSVSFVLRDNVLWVYLANSRVIKGGDESKAAGVVEYQINLDELLKPDLNDPTRPRFMRSSDMRERIAQGKAGESTDDYVYEIHRRHALAATYLLFLLLGFPTGILLRSGTQLAAFAVAVAYAIAYYVLSLRLADQLFATAVLPPAVAPWVTNALGGAVGAWLTLRVVRR